MVVSNFAIFLSAFFLSGVWSFEDQKISCRPGRGISDIWWSENNGYKTFSIACSNVTDSCEETCERSVECNIKRHGDGVYVRGMEALYDNMRNTQRILFLCCNSSDPTSRRCDGKLERLTGKPKSNGQQQQSSLRQATSNVGSAGSQVSILAETCSNDRSTVTCPLHKVKSKSKSDAGLAGLAGLAGIALLIKPKQQQQTTSCCCNDRWMGFVRNSSMNPPARIWIHGTASENVSWVPSGVSTSSQGLYPYCGYVAKISNQALWAEQSCSTNLAYFCQFLLSEVYEPITTPLPSSPAITTTTAGTTTETATTTPITTKPTATPITTTTTTTTTKPTTPTTTTTTTSDSTSSISGTPSKIPLSSQVQQSSTTSPLVTPSGSPSTSTIPSTVPTLTVEQILSSATSTERLTGTSTTKEPATTASQPEATPVATTPPGMTDQGTAATTVESTESVITPSPETTAQSETTVTSTLTSQTTSLETSKASCPSTTATTETPTNITTGTNFDCSSSPCRNKGVCVNNVSPAAICQCPNGFSGSQCEAPINPNYKPDLDEYCDETKGLTMEQYCYKLLAPAAPSAMEQQCVKQKALPIPISSPQLLIRLLQALGSPPADIDLGFRLTTDECGQSIPDPATAPADLLSTLGPVVFSGAGCAVLSQVAPSIYQIIGKDCEEARQFFCRHSEVPNPTSESKFVQCPNTKCYRNGFQSCDQTGRRCVCKPGWQGVICSEKIYYCDPNPCAFRGVCINLKAGYRCNCTSGFKGVNCTKDVDNSTDERYNLEDFVQKFGCAWIMFSSGLTWLIYRLAYDNSPIGVLKRQAMTALFCEHAVMIFCHSPATLGLNEHQCGVAAMIMFYFMTANLVLTLFQTFHVYYVMTGVTTGVEWGWCDHWWPYLTLGWGGPAVICLITWIVQFPQLSTPYSCMLDWNTGVTIWLVFHLFITLLTFVSLEQASMDARYQRIYASAIVDRDQLRAAKAGRCGTYLIAFMLPFSYLLPSWAVYTRELHFVTAAFVLNTTLGFKIFAVYVGSHPAVYAMVTSYYIKLLVKLGWKPPKKEQPTEIPTTSGAVDSREAARNLQNADQTDEPGPSHWRGPLPSDRLSAMASYPLKTMEAAAKKKRM